jgi:hypothetical protein
MIQMGDLIIVVVIIVGLEVGPTRGDLGLPHPCLGLDLARTASKRRADALSDVAVEVGLLGEVLTTVVAGQ